MKDVRYSKIGIQTNASEWKIKTIAVRMKVQ
jgi:hypothetical protein